MDKTLPAVASVEQRRFVIIARDLFDTAHKDEHVIADHTETVCDEHAPKQVSRPRPQYLFRSFQNADFMQYRVQQTVIRIVDVIDPHRSHRDGAHDIRKIYGASEKRFCAYAARQDKSEEQTHEHRTEPADTPNARDIVHRLQKNRSRK